MGRYLHRNSQKRIYIDGATYFLTAVTHLRYPYFAEPIFCELFIYDLSYAASLKRFAVHGYVVLPDHFHLLITPNGSANISMIMHNIKRNISHNANIMMGFIPSTGVGAGEDNYLHLHSPEGNANNSSSPPYYHNLPNWQLLKQLRDRFLHKYPQPYLEFPVFRWQHSFRDHVIRNGKDFDRHRRYLYGNVVKHGLASHPENYPWMWCEGMEQPFTTDVLIHTE
jgi:REP element-mobilizing transposase RayT